MGLNESIKKLKKNFSFLEISDEEFLEIYKTSKEEAKEESLQFVMLMKMKPFMNSNAIHKYIEKLNVDTTKSGRDLIKKIMPLFLLLDTIEYELKEEEICLLLNEPVIKSLFEKCVEKKKTITEKMWQSIHQGSINFKMVCDAYKEENVKIDLDDIEINIEEDFNKIE